MLVRPMLHLAFETLDDVRAALGEEMQRTPREDNAETERHVGTILLKHAHDTRRIAALEQVSEIEPRRTGTGDMEEHCDVP